MFVCGEFECKLLSRVGVALHVCCMCCAAALHVCEWPACCMTCVCCFMPVVCRVCCLHCCDVPFCVRCVVCGVVRLVSLFYVLLCGLWLCDFNCVLCVFDLCCAFWIFL